jgi:hypothetical protein
MTLDKYMINYFFQYMMDELRQLVKTTIEEFPVSSRNYAAVFRNTLLTELEFLNIYGGYEPSRNRVIVPAQHSTRLHRLAEFIPWN